jgi:hypothetical protein
MPVRGYENDFVGESSMPAAAGSSIAITSSRAGVAESIRAF